MSRVITMTLPFGKVDLPVTLNDKGEEVVPLKLISDLFGLDWASQHKKMQTTRMMKRMGTCIKSIPYAGQRREMLCIRLKRVVTFLNRINPEKVRAAGNNDGADFLEAKQDEWDEVLHAYEQQNGIFATEDDRAARSRSRDMNDFIKLQKAKDACKDEETQKVYDGLLKSQAKVIGVPYQSDAIH